MRLSTCSLPRGGALPQVRQMTEPYDELTETTEVLPGARAARICNSLVDFLLEIDIIFLPHSQQKTKIIFYNHSRFSNSLYFIGETNKVFLLATKHTHTHKEIFQTSTLEFILRPSRNIYSVSIKKI